MAYLPKLNPTVGGGLGGLPERRATGGGAVNSVRRSIIGQAVKGSLAYRNTTTGDTYSLDPIDDLTSEATLTLTSKLNQAAVAVAMFDDGKFVIVYTEMSANSTAFEVYNFDGTISVSQVIVESATSGGNRIAVQINPLNEQINILYSQGTGSGVIRRAVYSKTGTIVTAPYSLITGMSTSNDIGVLDFDFWSDGFFLVGVKTTTAAQYGLRIYNASATNINNDVAYSTYTTGRISVKCISASNRTFAHIETESGGLASGADRGFVKVKQYNGTSQALMKKFLIGDMGNTVTERIIVCNNDVDNELVGFHADQFQKVSMSPLRTLQFSSGTKTPSKQRALEDSTSGQFSALNIGGDRYLITYGGVSSGTALRAGIINSNGDWIATPTLCYFTSSNAFVKTAASKTTGRCVVCSPNSTTLLIKTFSYRNTTSETYRLKEEYPIKLADFNPQVNINYVMSFNVNASAVTNKFVTSWQQATGKDVTWSIHSSGGTLLGGPFVNTDIGGTDGVLSHKALLLPNGNVALILSVGSSIKMGIYDSSNTLQGSIITVITSVSGIDAEVALNGNIIIIYKANANSFLQRVVYSQTGTVVAAATAITGSAVNTDEIRVTYSTVNDNFICTFKNNGTSYFRFTILNASGTVLTSETAFGVVIASYSGVCANADGTYSIVLGHTNNLMYFSKVNANGTFAVAITSTSQTFIWGSQNQFQLLPNTSSEIMLVLSEVTSQHVECIAISNTTGLIVNTKKTFGVGSSWYEKYYIANAASYTRYPDTNFQNQVMVTTSANGDDYIATAWGDVYRLSSTLPLGEYVVDGIVNADTINQSTEVITNGFVNRNGNIPRITAFIANSASGKKIIASKKSISVS